MNEMRVLVIGGDADFRGMIRGVVAAQLPDAGCDHLDIAELRMRPTAAALVIDGQTDRDGADDVVRRVRAMGYTGALLIITGGAAADDGRLGSRAVAVDRLAHDLLPRLGEAIGEAASPFVDQVMRARRLVSAGEIALRLQHGINNALAGVLAEAQIMQLDECTAEQKESLERIIALCRRIIAQTRSLDGIGERAGGAHNGSA
jgi:hypothetical protein